GTMVACIGDVERAYSPRRSLVNASTEVAQYIASIDRVFEFYNETYDISDKANASQLGGVNGVVEFDNVSFHYDKDDGTVLKDINLRVEKGETIALVGMSGG